MTDKEQLSSPEDSVQSDLTESTVVRLSERVEQLEQQLNNVLLLLSDVYRYGKLRDLLAAQQWKEADLETTKVMLEIAGHSNHDNITPEDVIQFPCSSLRLLDKLWRQYSGDRFGFSLQQQIYVSEGGTDDISNIDLAILERVGDRMGWRANNKWLSYDQLDFSVSAPLGCHPSNWWRSAYGAKMAVYFLARLMQCDV
ncbi:GUN4 domain-containing protein [Limnoraphis robusta]|uniref:GUN4 domain-containing protein n=1 Tax=Limnoraphis robusta CCNP1315 TaxID=3110306 RepID=A0ABU5U134_9CYAN|nr:GUN4 domain-containing protein [Limnoraphis robusta]MEA5519853.1 GUN4 domain-containing protein [Limnoraphis robusta CCNP1315]MEA5547888.1 GUN4 domain-containing protein [Limnoraphis robusta CCNP1324]